MNMPNQYRVHLVPSDYESLCWHYLLQTVLLNVTPARRSGSNSTLLGNGLHKINTTNWITDGHHTSSLMHTQLRTRCDTNKRANITMPQSMTGPGTLLSPSLSLCPASQPGRRLSSKQRRLLLLQWPLLLFVYHFIVINAAPNNAMPASTSFSATKGSGTKWLS